MLSEFRSAVRTEVVRTTAVVLQLLTSFQGPRAQNVQPSVDWTCNFRS